MNEFNNRIIAQRETLITINRHDKYHEPLMGLSEKAIDRWVTNNNIDRSHRSIYLLKEISENLFFLANKSQEQITDDYKKLSVKVSVLIAELKDAISSQTILTGQK